MLLVLTHRRLADRAATAVEIAGGWHAHLGILTDRLNAREPRPFWSTHAAVAARLSEAHREPSDQRTGTRRPDRGSGQDAPAGRRRGLLDRYRVGSRKGVLERIVERLLLPATAFACFGLESS